MIEVGSLDLKIFLEERGLEGFHEFEYSGLDFHLRWNQASRGMFETTLRGGDRILKDGS